MIDAGSSIEVGPEQQKVRSVSFDLRDILQLTQATEPAIKIHKSATVRICSRCAFARPSRHFCGIPTPRDTMVDKSSCDVFLRSAIAFFFVLEIQSLFWPCSVTDFRLRGAERLSESSQVEHQVSFAATAAVVCVEMLYASYCLPKCLEFHRIANPPTVEKLWEPRRRDKC